MTAVPWVAWAVVAAVVSACSLQPIASDARLPSPTVEDSVQAGDGPTFRQQWDAALAERLRQASPFERELIGDGVVTQDEHERAILAYLDCLRRQDLANVSIDRAPSGMIGELSIPGDHDASVVLACQRDFYTLARLGYGSTTYEPNGTEAGQLRQLAACLRERGITEAPVSPATIVELDAVVDAIAAGDHENTRDAKAIFGDCQDRILW